MDQVAHHPSLIYGGWMQSLSFKMWPKKGQYSVSPARNRKPLEVSGTILFKYLEDPGFYDKHLTWNICIVDD